MRASTRVLPAAGGEARRAPRQARSKATVDAILDAAAEVLRTDGYDTATTNRVAEVAGVSIGSLYQYFPNKQALLLALVERHNAAMWAVFSQHATAAIGRPFAEVVPTFIDAMFACHVVDPALQRVLHDQIPRVGALAIVRATMARCQTLVEQLLRSTDAQLPPIDDVPLAALVIVESVEALIHASLELPPARVAGLRRQAARLVLRYLGVDEPAARPAPRPRRLARPSAGL